MRPDDRARLDYMRFRIREELAKPKTAEVRLHLEMLDTWAKGEALIADTEPAVAAAERRHESPRLTFDRPAPERRMAPGCR